MVRIIGVAADSKYVSPWEEPQPYIYGLSTMLGPAQASLADYLFLRTRTAPETLIPIVRRIWDEVGNGQPHQLDLRTFRDETLKIPKEATTSG